jgi:hypothetical protein
MVEGHYLCFALTFNVAALTLALNFINAFTSSTLLYLAALMSGISPSYNFSTNKSWISLGVKVDYFKV